MFCLAHKIWYLKFEKKSFLILGKIRSQKGTKGLKKEEGKVDFFLFMGY
jgi:hypothetical protein